MADPFWRGKIGSEKAARRTLSRMRRLPIRLHKAGAIADNLRVSADKKRDVSALCAEVKESLRVAGERWMEVLDK